MGFFGVGSGTTEVITGASCICIEKFGIYIKPQETMTPTQIHNSVRKMLPFCGKWLLSSAGRLRATGRFWFTPAGIEGIHIAATMDFQKVQTKKPLLG